MSVPSQAPIKPSRELSPTGGLHSKQKSAGARRRLLHFFDARIYLNFRVRVGYPAELVTVSGHDSFAVVRHEHPDHSVLPRRKE